MNKEKISNKAIYLGCLPKQVDIRDYKLNISTAAIDFPDEFELPTEKVKNQGAVCSCVAHAVAEVIEYYHKKQNNLSEEMSVGFIYGNRRNSLSKSPGMYLRSALSNTCKYGDVLSCDFPENREVPEAINLFEARFDTLKDRAYLNRFSTYFKLTSDNDIKYALINYGPVIFAIKWYSDLSVDKNGIMQSNKNSKDFSGNHCMIIYGWDKNGWKIQNSWGKGWGKAGKAILPYNYKKSETWGVTDSVTTDSPEIKRSIFNTTFLRWLAKCINFVINLFRGKSK